MARNDDVGWIGMGQDRDQCRALVHLMMDIIEICFRREKIFA